MEPKFYVMLGDVISSRQLKNRDEFQDKVINACHVINKEFNDKIYAKFNILKGTDEIGAVLSDISNFYDIILKMSDNIGLNTMRFVIAKGDIDIGLNQKDVSRMDGAAFHQAAELMADLKKKKLIFQISTSNEIFDRLVENNINLIYLVEKKWSDKKIRIINEYRKGKDQNHIAKKFNIGQQDVSYHIQSSNFKEIQEIEENLKHIIKLHSQGI